MEAKVTHVKCKFMKNMLLHEAWDNLILLLEPTQYTYSYSFTFYIFSLYIPLEEYILCYPFQAALLVYLCEARILVSPVKLKHGEKIKINNNVKITFRTR